MPRRAAVIAFCVIFLSTPAFAITAKEKMDTCKFGADDQKLTSAPRKKFISKCMANADTPAPRPKKEKKDAKQ
jgi:hypothetical protein